jgi:hypothetical protein
MGGLSPAHIDYLHIVVGVLRKMHETGMGPDGNELSGFQELIAVNDHVLTIHIQGPVNICTACQYLLFFFCNDAQALNQLLVHINPLSIIKEN